MPPCSIQRQNAAQILMDRARYINIYFSDKDKDLIAWANMIRDANQSIPTWIQAILLAEDAKISLDAGAVHVPDTKAATPLPNRGKFMFGNDAQIGKEAGKIVSGWQVRGRNGEMIEGSIIAIRVTRPVMIALIEKLQQTHQRLGPYVKAVLRKNIRRLDSGPHQIPNGNHLTDIFALYEEKYLKHDPYENIPAGESRQQKRENQNTAKKEKQVATSLPARENNRNSSNRNGAKQTSQSGSNAPVPSQHRQMAAYPNVKDSPTKAKNPLLGYIN